MHGLAPDGENRRDAIAPTGSVGRRNPKPVKPDVPEPSVDAPTGQDSNVRKLPNTRLVVELSPANALELTELTALEGVNKTNLVNRAVQLYSIVRKAQAEGAQVLIKHPGESVVQWLRII